MPEALERIVGRDELLANVPGKLATSTLLHDRFAVDLLAVVELAPSGAACRVEMPDELVLRPVPKDPVRDLQEIGRALKGRSAKDSKAMIDEQARREVGL